MLARLCSVCVGIIEALNKACVGLWRACVGLWRACVGLWRGCVGAMHLKHVFSPDLTLQVYEHLLTCSF